MQKVLRSFTDFTLRHRWVVLVVFALLTLVFAFCIQGVSINYNMAEYLPEGAASTVAMEVLRNEYGQEIPNARVMAPVQSIPEALELKGRLAAIEGVEAVLWLDDSVSLSVPLEMADADAVADAYKDGYALYTLTINNDLATTAIHSIREVAGEGALMSGRRVETTFSMENIVGDLFKILCIAIPIILCILLLTTESWFEPLLFLATIGVAIVLNMGTNIFFKNISFITKGVASILQLAVSMDYAIFILHRFSEYRREGQDVSEAMRNAVASSFSSVTASGLTTLIGFAALIVMRVKIGPDIGWVMMKAIALSLLCVFTLLPVLTVVFHKAVEKTRHRSLLPKPVHLTRCIQWLRFPLLALLLVIATPFFLATMQNHFVYLDMFNNERTSLGREAKQINAVFGEANNAVLLLPRGDLAKEKEAADRIRALPTVSSLLSYTETVGAEVPAQWLPGDTLSQLVSPHYTRMVLVLNAPMESEAAFDTVVALRAIGEELYGPGQTHLAGESANTYDMKFIIEEDNLRINLIAIGSVFLVLLLTFRSLSLPLLLVFVIETSIWVNCGLQYFMGESIYYFAYLFIGCLQLGATVDYAILYTNRYLEHRRLMGRRAAFRASVETSSVSILTSGGVLFVAGFVLQGISTNALLAQMGTLVGRGALLSLASVLFVLPALLFLLDGLVQKTTLNCHLHRDDPPNTLPAPMPEENEGHVGV